MRRRGEPSGTEGDERAWGPAAPGLPERGPALDVLHRAFAGCRDGAGSVVVVRGAPGCGRTALVQHFVERLADTEALVLTATGTPVERELPMGVAGQLVHQAALSSEAVRATLGGGSSVATGVDPLAVHGVCAALLELTAHRPVVIVVDDHQFVDDASRQVLQSLSRRVRGARLLVVLTEWMPTATSVPVRGAELAGRPRPLIELPPLSQAGVTEVLAAELGREAALRSGLACYGNTGGHPLLVRALVEDLRVYPDETEGGPAFRQAVLYCLDRWDDEISAVARGIAVLGAHTTPELLVELLQLPVYAVRTAIGVLTAAGLSTEDGVLRPGIAAVLADQFPAGDMAVLNAVAAQLLYDHGADAIELVRWVVAAGAGPGPWFRHVLRQASEQALVTGETEPVIGGLELAIRECGDEDERLACRVQLMRLAWWSNPAKLAPHIEPLVAAVPEGRLVARDAVAVIRYLFWQGDLARAVRLMPVLEDLAGDDSGTTLAELRLACEWLFGMMRGNPPEAVRSFLPPSGRGTDGSSLDRAEHILQGRLDGLVPEAAVMALLVLDHGGKVQRARHWCGVLGEAARQRGAVTWQALLSSISAEMALSRGDLVTAQTQAAAALRLLNRQSWGVLIGLPLSTLLSVHVAKNDLAAAGEVLNHVVPVELFGTTFGLRYLNARARYHLASDRPLAAIRDLERCGHLMREWDFDLPAVVPWRAGLAEAYLRLGREEHSRAMLAEQLDRLGADNLPRVKAMSLRLLAASGAMKDRVPRLRKAVQLLETCGDRVELTYALAALSIAHRELGDEGRARLVARRTDLEAKACGMPNPLTRRLPEQAAPETPRQSQEFTLDELSDAERKVATLAALGQTNREIGRKLYITVSTVEQHLTRVYRKLNVRKRSDLPAELTRRAPGDRLPELALSGRGTS
ncbi:AAA family ATPase [Amycolatopsis sp. NPDC057786]|uniref:AAA family ATPase n=1 Tax=Amycolatopsis sp. NPDC057786 TaxID=3346250 RepID=UPI00366CB955